MSLDNLQDAGKKEHGVGFTAHSTCLVLFLARNSPR